MNDIYPNFPSLNRFILVETGDEFTRNFYRKLDIVDFTPIQLSSI